MSPRGPFGLPRLTNIGPLVELTRDEKIEKALSELCHSVTVTDDGYQTRFTYRLNIPEDRTKLNRRVYSTQNIPSNMAVRGEYASGDIRPPMISSNVGSENEVHDRILDTLSEDNRDDVEIFIPTEGNKGYRPHISYSNIPIEGAFSIIADLNDNYYDEFS